MNKFIKNIILFIAIAIPLYIVLLILFGELMPPFLTKNLKYKKGGIGFMDKRLSDIKKAKTIDVLFIGSSHTYRAFDPRIFKKKGFNIFNLGSSAQTPIVSKYLIDEYLNTLEPKKIVLEVYPELLTTDGVESTLNVISNKKMSLSLIDFSFKFKNLTIFNTLIFSIYKDLTKGGVINSYNHGPNTDKYIYNGYVESSVVFKTNKKIEKKRYLKLNKSQLTKLDEIISLLKEKNIPLTLIQTPITTGKFNSFTNNKLIDSILKAKAKYINFNNFLKLKDSLFIDGDHLNQRGVNYFNEKIFEHIRFIKQ